MTIEIGISMNYHFSADNIERAYLDHTYFDVFAEYDVLCRPILPVNTDQKLNKYLDTISGVVFTGGLDLDTRLWDIPLHPKAELVHKRRLDFEIRMLQEILNRKIPLLGICLGMQMVNMFLGGEMCQHLPEMEESINHGYDGEKTRHKVSLHPESKLTNWLGADAVEVASAHHQGITKAGKGLLESAKTSDGVVEAVEMPEHPFLVAVQWHPEKAIEETVNRTIFDSFLEAADGVKPKN
ncbi:MAG: gamma-glutamyl-gamma-aminobutyrate hydrolase family protein [Proteobacteria bacterium]|nr:gamma-glutamyl-gamma-aminobutyrate hydrolase family protein [Pseudomonadota bacterium]